MSYPLAGVKNPVTVPAMVNVPSGPGKVFRLAGMLQVTVGFAWFCFADVSVSLCDRSVCGCQRRISHPSIGRSS